MDREKTPRVFGGARGLEIDDWLSKNLYAGETRFVILDDESDMAHLIDHLVQTNMETGLTEAHADAATKMLNESRP